MGVNPSQGVHQAFLKVKNSLYAKSHMTVVFMFLSITLFKYHAHFMTKFVYVWGYALYIKPHHRPLIFNKAFAWPIISSFYKDMFFALWETSISSYAIGDQYVIQSMVWSWTLWTNICSSCSFSITILHNEFDNLQNSYAHHSISNSDQVSKSWGLGGTSNIHRGLVHGGD